MIAWLFDLVLASPEPVITAPLYRPQPDCNYGYEPLDLNHNNWRRLDALRDEAVRLGLPPDQLPILERGFCPDQVDEQIRLLQRQVCILQHQRAA